MYRYLGKNQLTTLSRGGFIDVARLRFAQDERPKVPLPGPHPFTIWTCFIVYSLRGHGPSMLRGLVHAYGEAGY